MSLYERLVSETAASRNEFLAIPLLQQALQGDVTLDQYRAFLAQAYHHVRHTVPLLMGFGYHLPERLQWLHAAVMEYIDEEKGHEEWILDYIAACGGDVAAVCAAGPAASTEVMVAYAHDVIRRCNPIGFFGMVFVLEGTSAQLATRAADVIARRLQLPLSAFRYLTSQGSLDQDHVAFDRTLIDKPAAPEDQPALTHGANLFYRLYGDIFRSLAPTTTH